MSIVRSDTLMLAASAAALILVLDETTSQREGKAYD